MNRLPIANTLAGSGKLFGHFSSNAEWDRLAEDSNWKKDERFKAALRYLLQNSYTHTLFFDLYPVKIDNEHVHPGTVFIFLRESDGHTQTIASIGPISEDPRSSWIYAFYGEEPASTDIIESYLLSPPDDFFSPDKSGFKLWRWPRKTAGQWELTPAIEMPGYSLEQYHAPIYDPKESSAFFAWVMTQLGYEVDPSMLVLLAASEFQVVIDQRKQTTALAQVYCGLNKCAKGSQAYNDFSTEARDARLRQLKSQIMAYFAKYGPGDDKVHFVKSEYSRLRVFKEFDLSYFYLFDKQRNLLEKFSPDANADFSDRWALDEFFNSKDKNLISLAYTIWWVLDKRADLVNQAQAFCFKNNNTEITCDPSSPEIMSLDTTLIDRYLMDAAPSLNLAISGNQFDKTSIAKILDQFESTKGNADYNFCNTQFSPCYYSDLILGDLALGRLKNWQSSPLQALNRRWGIEN